MVKVFPMVHPNASCDYHRIDLPFKFIPDSFKAKTLQEADVITFNRIPTIDINTLQSFKGKKKIIADLDDYWQLPTWHPKHLDFKNFHANDIVRCLTIADEVTTTTDQLAEMIYPINKNVHIIPNAIPFGKDQFVVSELSKTDVIYAGDHNHKPDVDLIYGTHPISVVSVGYNLGGKIIPRRSVIDYMKVYDTAMIALAPIADGNDMYNRCKSNLKLLEAAAKKIPIIASNVPTYNNFNAPILFDNWRDNIMLLKNEDVNKQFGQALYEWGVKNYNLFEWNLKRLEIYCK